VSHVADTWVTITCDNENNKSQVKVQFTSFSANSEVKLLIIHTGKELNPDPVKGLFSDVPILKKFEVKSKIEIESFRAELRAMSISVGLLFAIFLPLWLMLSVPDNSQRTRTKRAGQAALVCVIGVAVIIMSFFVPDLVQFPQPPT